MLDNGNSHHLLQLEPAKTVEHDCQILWRYTPRGTYFAREVDEQQPVLAATCNDDSSGTDSCSHYSDSDSGEDDDVAKDGSSDGEDDAKDGSSDGRGATPKAAGKL
jgi:hypothetical protein